MTAVITSLALKEEGGKERKEKPYHQGNHHQLILYYSFQDYVQAAS
jgi:hypothetical protein